MKKEIIALDIDPKEFGLEKNEAEQIKAFFIPMIDKMVEMEKEYNEIVNLEPSDENCAKAWDLRKKFVKIRTTTAEIHKKTKAYYLNWGRAVDAFKNLVTFATQKKEDNLDSLENYFVNYEKQQKMEKWIKRAQELRPYDHFNNDFLGGMQEEAYQLYKIGVIKSYEDKKEQEKKDMLEKDKKDQEEKERIEKLENENARLKKIEEEQNETKMKEKQKELDNMKLAKDEKYKEFLKQHEWKYDKIIEKDWVITLYKEVATFITNL